MNSLCPSGSVIACNFQFQVQLNLMGQHKNKFSCTRVSTELLLIGYAGKIRLMTETCILLTIYLILLIPRRFADRVSQTSAIYSSSISKKMYTLLVEQVTILNGVTAGWAVTKTNTNSDHGVL